MKKQLGVFFKTLRARISSINDKWIVFGIIIFFGILLSIIIKYRFAVYDEKLFLHETVMMSEVFKKGEWIGNYGVGVHGFLFKLPIAIIFIFTGANIYIATFFHVILAMLTAWIFYRFLNENFKLGKWNIIAVILLLTNYTFFSYSTTFHREIPVLFALMLFLYYLVKNCNKYLLNGLLLLLVLDAKEYVFFALLIPLFAYLFLQKYQNLKNFFKSLLYALKGLLIMLIPSVIYLVLMFYTSVLPINMFNASFLGYITSQNYQLRHVLPENALSDMSTYTNDNVAYSSVEESNSLNIKSILLLIVGYFEKLLYITNFSFQGIPLVILIISCVTSIYLFKQWYRGKRELLFLNIFLWGYLFIYMIRASHQRYILTIIPISIIFFIYFLYLIIHKWDSFRKYFLWILILCGLATVASTIYQKFSGIKELFNIFGSLTITMLTLGLFYLKKYRKVIVYLIVVFTISASLFISVYALFSKNQIYKSNLWGVNGEADKIAKLLKPSDVVFVDCKSSDESEFTYLINIYRGNNYLPIEWTWKLDKNKVQRELDAIEIKPNFYYESDPSDMVKFKEYIIENNINRIILLQSTVEGKVFTLEKYLEIFKNENWMYLESITEMKNKNIYLFNVIDEKF